jgi:hypothetical protein
MGNDHHIIWVCSCGRSIRISVPDDPTVNWISRAQHPCVCGQRILNLTYLSILGTGSPRFKAEKKKGTLLGGKCTARLFDTDDEGLVTSEVPTLAANQMQAVEAPSKPPQGQKGAGARPGAQKPVDGASTANRWGVAKPPATPPGAKPPKRGRFKITFD